MSCGYVVSPEGQVLAVSRLFACSHGDACLHNAGKRSHAVERPGVRQSDILPFYAMQTEQTEQADAQQRERRRLRSCDLHE